VRRVTLVILATRIVLYALRVYSRHQKLRQSANIANQAITLQSLPPCVLHVNLEKFQVSVLSYVKTALPAREKRITNAMLVVQVVSVKLELVSVTLPVLPEHTGNKEKPLAMIARPVNTRHLGVPFADFASVGNGATLHLLSVMIVPLVIIVSA